MDALVKPANDTLHRNLRRYEVRLKVTAAGVLIFAFWGIIKSVMMTIMNAEENGGIAKQIADISNKLDSDDKLSFFILAIAVFALIFVLDTAFRVGLFMFARKESQDPSVKRKKSYFVMGAILIAGNIFSIYTVAKGTYNGDYEILDGALSILIEFTSMVIVFELLQSLVKVRKIRDELAKTQEVQQHETPKELTLEDIQEKMAEQMESMADIPEQVGKQVKSVTEMTKELNHEVGNVVKEATDE